MVSAWGRKIKPRERQAKAKHNVDHLQEQRNLRTAGRLSKTHERSARKKTFFMFQCHVVAWPYVHLYFMILLNSTRALSLSYTNSWSGTSDWTAIYWFSNSHLWGLRLVRSLVMLDSWNVRKKRWHVFDRSTIRIIIVCDETEKICRSGGLKSELSVPFSEAILTFSILEESNQKEPLIPLETGVKDHHRYRVIINYDSSPSRAFTDSRSCSCPFALLKQISEW